MAFFGPPPPFTGATTANAGASGLVPAPSAGNSSRSLSSNGSFIENLPIPKYKNTTDIIPSSIFSFGPTLPSASANTPVINVRTFVFIYLPSNGDIDELLFRTGTSAPSPAYNIHVGLWKVSDNGEPSDYIIGGSGSTGTSANTDVSISVSSTSVLAGLHYLSITPDASGTANSLASQLSGNSGLLRRSLGAANLGTSTGNSFSYTCLTSYQQTTHETFSVSSVANFTLGIRYA